MYACIGIGAGISAFECLAYFVIHGVSKNPIRQHDAVKKRTSTSSNRTIALTNTNIANKSLSELVEDFESELNKISDSLDEFRTEATILHTH